MSPYCRKQQVGQGCNTRRRAGWETAKHGPSMEGLHLHVAKLGGNIHHVWGGLQPYNCFGRNHGGGRAAGNGSKRGEEANAVPACVWRERSSPRACPRKGVLARQGAQHCKHCQQALCHTHPHPPAPHLVLKHVQQRGDDVGVLLHMQEEKGKAKEEGMERRAGSGMYMRGRADARTAGSAACITVAAQNGSSRPPALHGSGGAPPAAAPSGHPGRGAARCRKRLRNPT